MKNTLIIPASGKSSRFPNMKPKWLLTHPDGELMIEKVLSSFNFDEYENVFLTILQHHEDKYSIVKTISQIYDTKISVCLLPNPTESAVETVYQTIMKNNIKGFITIKDADCYVKANFQSNRNFVCGMVIDSDSKVEKIQNKSFINKNDNDVISDIQEKNIISNTICVGVYSIAVNLFLDAFKAIKQSPSYGFDNELYISHIISYLIYNKNNFDFIPALEFIDWGSLKEWRSEQKKYKTFFFDIDGVLVKNVPKHGSKNWFNSLEIIKNNMKVLKKLSLSGHQIIFTTSRSSSGVSLFKNFLQEQGIKYKQIITDCYHSQRVIINDFASTNPYPSCIAINIPRNQELQIFLDAVLEESRVELAL
jgi:CMP-2-keto-3-deoxyoctulosonic acid synthetase